MFHEVPEGDCKLSCQGDDPHIMASRTAIRGSRSIPRGERASRLVPHPYPDNLDEQRSGRLVPSLADQNSTLPGEHSTRNPAMTGILRRHREWLHSEPARSRAPENIGLEKPRPPVLHRSGSTAASPPKTTEKSDHGRIGRTREGKWRRERV